MPKLRGLVIALAMAMVAAGRASARPVPQPEAPQCSAAAFSEDERVRWTELRARLAESIVRVRELPRGAEYVLAGEPAVLRDVGEWIALENRCCAFLEFRVRWHGAGSLIRVRVRGPEGTRELLADALGRRDG